MALVSQDILLFNDTLKNNMIYGLERDISTTELETVAKKARLYDYIMGLPAKFETSIGDRGIKLSGGEKQRLAIARALLKNTEILILDEATSSLDSTTERLIQEAIREAVKGRTTIVIAHRFSTIKDVDKIVVLEDGKFIEEGKLNELLSKKGKFYEYWQAQKFY
jgi:ABC-type multidrug transport system fused ATPase/permease subunit